MPRWLALSLLAAGAAACRSTAEPIVASARADGALALVSWFGNSFPADEERHAVQRTISDIAVRPDGTVWTYSAYGGGGFRAVAYKDGRWAGRLPVAPAGGGDSIAVEEPWVYVDDTSNMVERVTRISTEGADSGHSFPLPANAEVRGLAVGGGELFVANHAGGEILVFATEPPGATPLRRFPLARAGELALERGVALWAIQERQPGAEARIVALDPHTGRELPGREIRDVEEPRDLALDGQGRLWVADAGVEQRLRVYRLGAGAPALVSHFGERGGIFAGAPGSVAPLKLNQPNAVGVDAAGNVCVNHAMRGLGARLECYTPDGARLWAVTALGAVYDGAAADPGDEDDVYGKAFRFQMDWTAPAGEEARFVGFTEGPAFDRPLPDDRVTRDSPISVLWAVRRIGGRPFPITTRTSGHDHLVFYRRTGLGELSAPAAMIAKRGGGAWPPGQPAGGPWLWRDGDGDGKFDPDEYEALPLGPLDGDDWWVDETGAVWIGATRNPTDLLRLRPAGLDARGVPELRAAARDLFRAPEPFERVPVDALAYVAASDTMYLSGSPPARPRPDGAGGGYLGTTVARYDRFTDPARRRKVWERALEWDRPPEGIPHALTLAGRYLFVVHKSGCVVRVYDTESDRPPVATLRPAGRVFTDRENGAVSAALRKNGEYAVFVDEGFYRKVVLYRWHPAAPQALTAAAAGPNVTLTWTRPVEGDPVGYHVHRSRSGRTGYVRLTDHPLPVTRFTDGGAGRGTSFYRVSAVGADGKATFSPEVAVEVP